MDFMDSPADPTGTMLVETPPSYRPSRGDVPNQKAAYLAAKHDRQCRAIHVSNNVSCALFTPPGQLESFMASSSTCSISSSNECNSEGAVGQGRYCNRLLGAAEVHKRDKSLQIVRTVISGVVSCASFTEGARASAAEVNQAKSKKASKRGGKAAGTAGAIHKPRPCKQQATEEAWTGRRKEAAKKNLAKQFEIEE